MSYLGAYPRKAGVLVSQILIDVHVHLTSFDGFRVWSMVIYISLLLTKK